MSRRRRVAAAVAALLLAGTACGSREVALTAEQAAAQGLALGSVPGDAAGPVRASTAQRGVYQAAAPRKTGQPKRVGGYDPVPEKRILPLKVTILPECASPGMSMTATTKTAPGAAITFAVAFPDGQTYGNWGTARADPATGTFVYAWAIPPTAALGEGHYLVGVTEETIRKSNAGSWPFRVAPRGGCP